MTANRRYRIAVQDLRLNMFVVELDRPWLDTPFLLQGFLIDDQVELDTLARYCNYVYVDLELSSPSVAMDIRVADANFGRLSETRPMPNAIAHEPPTSPTTIIHAHSAPNSEPAPAAPATANAYGRRGGTPVGAGGASAKVGALMGASTSAVATAQPASIRLRFTGCPFKG